MRNNEFTKILKWPGYRVWQWAIDEKRHELKLWVRRKSGNRKYQCSGCGRKFPQYCDFTQRQVRDLPWGQYQTIVVIEVHRVRCPDCGVKVAKVPQLPGKAPFSERFEDEVGRRCESAPVRQVARQVVLAASRVPAIELRYLERWDRRRRRSPVHRIGWMRFIWACRSF